MKNRKFIENIKVILGMILLLFPVIGGLIFFLEGFGILNNFLSSSNISGIFESGSINANYGKFNNNGSGGGASNTPIFLGLCGIAGAYLLGSNRNGKSEIRP